jgi:hypothetical protein
MSTPILTGYIPSYSPLTNITPFTYRDGLTYLEVLEGLRTYLNDTVIDFINTNFTNLGLSVEADVQLQVERVNTALMTQATFVTNALTTQSAAVKTSIDNMVIYVNNEVAKILANTVAQATKEISDSLANPASTLSVAFSKNYDRVYKPEAYGAIGDGVADDTSAVIAAFNAANADAKAGLVASILHPGATVVMDGIYNLATLAGPITITCDLRGGASTVRAPANYANTVFIIGRTTSGDIFQNADIIMPDVVKVGNTTLTPGSVGVKVQNLYNSNVTFARTTYFETGIHFTGLGNGTVYNRFFVGWISYCKVSMLFKPSANGHVNQNTFVGGGMQQSPSFDGGGTKRAGWRHAVLDGASINSVNGNTFVGVSFEGDVSEFILEFKHALDNVFIGCRFEQGTAGKSVSLTADTFISANHGLTVGRVITFSATTLPTGLIAPNPYYVVEVASVDTFKISKKKGGPVITFATNGAGITYFRPAAIKYTSATNQNVTRNVISEPVNPLIVFEQIFEGLTYENPIESGGKRLADSFADNDTPLFKARNGATSAARRPGFAAYPPGVNPVENPDGWTTGIGDRGVLFQESEAEAGRLFVLAGGIRYRRPADNISYEIASSNRTPGLIQVTSLNVLANSTATFDFTLTGTSVNDHMVVTPGVLPAGIVYGGARVSAIDTVRVTFGNVGVADILITVQLQAISFRRFF